MLFSRDLLQKMHKDIVVKKKKVSLRTCIACRKVEKKVFDSTEFVRLVWRNGGVEVDIEQSLPGRGAYIHARLDCINKLSAPKIWEKAFKLGKGEVSKELLNNMLNILRNNLLNEEEKLGISEERIKRKRLF
jgi:predicted RNA-binding protein YlxR (DUF448 family)